MIFQFWKNLFCFAFLPLYFGGGGGSSAATTTTTTNNTSTNTQETVDGGSTSIHAGGNVTMTDNGAVQAALSSSTSNFSTLIDAFKAMGKGQADSLQANISLAKDLNATTASAYKDAASQASGNKNIVYVGLAIVAVVGLSFMRKG